MNEKEKEAYIAYLKNRKSSTKTNYYVESLKEMKNIKANTNKKPKLLLHACCIVCACWPLEFLHEVFDVTIMYNNSNIWPASEYDMRLSDMKRYLDERWYGEIKLVIEPYNYDAFDQKLLAKRKDDPEGWLRCFSCYTERMNAAFAYADENGYDYFTTVMTFSRQKDSQKLNEIGRSLQQKYSHTKYFYSDFKKGNGQQHSTEISDAYCLYRQDYCGCKYSYDSRKKDKCDS